MKTRIPSAALAVITLATLTTACGEPLEVELDEADASGTGQPRPNNTPAACDGAKADCDGDGRLGSADCAPSDPAAFVGANEICDGKDNDCDGQTDEGCPSGPTPPTGSQCVDADGDGFCTLSGPIDCNDQDDAVNPGSTEVCGNGKDDDCDGQTDEGCPGTTPPPAPNGQALACTFTFGSSGSHSARYQVIDHKADLFGWWDNPADAAVSGTSVSLSAPYVEADSCGVRLNTTSDGASWLCTGNGATATLNPNIGVSCTFGTRTATKADLVAVSHPAGVQYGCSAYWRWMPASADCP